MAEDQENQATDTASAADTAELDRVQGAAARTLRNQLEAKRRARQALYQATADSAAAATSSMPAKYRQLRAAMRTLQAMTAVGTSLGDVFFSLTGLFLSINVSRYVLPKVLPGYKLEGVDKMLFIIGWFVVLVALFIIIGVFVGLAYYADKLPGAGYVLKKII